ncbi:MAG: hypothetical protein Ct9H300mP14_00380 [Gammaproteobacteria bacterium]|nr:MAG: hypothetical protein Ct9H300mP14_00380 [Gammaproteobacteria bacterium]
MLKPGKNQNMIFRLLLRLHFTRVLELVKHRHSTFPWEGWLGFYAVWGFVSLFGVVIIGKQLRRFIKRREDYYDE